MKKVKGVVMRTTDKKTVIYTKEGDFLEVPNSGERPPVGQVIEVTLPSRRPSIKGIFLKYAAAAAVLILATVLGVFNPLFGPGAAVASVALDVNYGIELLVNKEARVIKARDVSKGSDYLVDGPDLKGQNIYQAVELIMDDAGKKGFLGKEENLVLVSVVPLDKRGVNVVDETKLKGVVRDEMIRKNIYGVVMVGQADGETRQRAENLGMTVNNYMVYERCREDGLNVQTEAFRGGDIRQALAGANASLPELFPGKSFEVREQEGDAEHRSEQQGSGQNPIRRDMPGGNTSGNWGNEDCDPAVGAPGPAQPAGGAPTPVQPSGATAPKTDGQKAPVNHEQQGQPGTTENWRSMRESGWWMPWDAERKRTTNTSETWNNESRH